MGGVSATIGLTALLAFAHGSVEHPSVEARIKQRAVLIGDGVEPQQWQRLLRVLNSINVEALPEADAAGVRAELSAHGVQCSDDTVDCLARLVVLADVERAIRVWPADGALEILVVDATPVFSRARLRDRDGDDGWRAALEAALLLAPSDEPVTLPPEPAPVVEAPASPSTLADERGLGALGVAGAAALGAGGVGVVVAGLFGVLAIQAVGASEAAQFQDDAVERGEQANTWLGLGGATLAASALLAGGGVALVLLEAGPAAEDG